MKRPVCVICALILCLPLVPMLNTVHAGAARSQVKIGDRYWYQFKNGTPTNEAVTVMFEGNTSLDTVWLYDFFALWSAPRQNFINGLCAAGYDVFVPNCTSGPWAYNGTQTFVHDLMTWQLTTGYNFLCLFGFSAGGVIAAYEIQKDYATGFSSAVLSSAPVNWAGHGPIFHSAQTASKDKVATCFVEGKTDPFHNQMLLYYNSLCTTYARWYNWNGGNAIFKNNCSDYPGEDVKTAVINWNGLVPLQLNIGSYYWYNFKNNTHTNNAVIAIFGGTCTPAYSVIGNLSIPTQGFIDSLRAAGYDVFVPNCTSGPWAYSGNETFVHDAVVWLQANDYGFLCLFGFSAGGVVAAYEIQKDYATRLSTAVLASAPVNVYGWGGIYRSARTASNDKVATCFLEGQNDTYRNQMLKYYNNALTDKQWLNWSDGHSVFLYNCSDYPGEDVKTAVISWNNAAHPPNTPFTPTGPTVVYLNTTSGYTSCTFDPNGDNVSYVFNWGDGTYTNTNQCPSGQNITASHAWVTAGPYNITVQCEDSTGLWSVWSPPLTVDVT